MSSEYEKKNEPTQGQKDDKALRGREGQNPQGEETGREGQGSQQKKPTGQPGETNEPEAE